MIHKAKTLRIAMLAAVLLAGSGCSVFKKSAPKTPVLGERIPVLDVEGDVQVDPAATSMPMSLPTAVVNTDWAMTGGNASKSMGHLALGSALARVFTVQAGRGSSLTARLAAAPIVANGHVFTIDTLGAARSFDAQTGALLWASQTPSEKESTASLYGGGIAYSNGRIIATNGLGYVASLDERNGGIVWQVRPGGPLRGAPTVADGTIYVMSQDNQIFSLKEADGARNWSQAAALEIAGIFGSASPAVGSGTATSARSTEYGATNRTALARVALGDAIRTSLK